MPAADALSPVQLAAVYFVYGLAFFVMGVAVLLEASRPSTLRAARVLPFLAAFGLIHGVHEWIDMYRLISSVVPTTLLEILCFAVLASSFVVLVEFGIRLLSLEGNRRSWQIVRWAILAIFVAGVIAICVVWGTEDGVWPAVGAWCRYSLAVPGAILAAAGLSRQARRLAAQQAGVARDLLIVGIAFLLYGIVGQVFVGESRIPPSNVVNSALYLELFGHPVQLFRAATAIVIAVFVVLALRVFEVQRQLDLSELDQAREDAQRRLNEAAAERQVLQHALLRQTVHAQESERKTIAREMHDQIGQALTALSWGLVGVEEIVSDCPDIVLQRIREMQRLADQLQIDLRNITTRLRPPVLDELGLVPALITYADNCAARFPFTVKVNVAGRRSRLRSEIETSLYRITQEAVTNVAKHAQATHVSVSLEFGEQEIRLAVQDNGMGMDVDKAGRAAASGEGWGLAGISERAQLLGGSLNVRSSPGAGAVLTVRIPRALGGDKREPNQTAAG